MADLYNTQVNLSGLLEVLGKNLYSNPTVVVRELIQNAHDACQRRRIEDPACPQNLSIHVTTDWAQKQLIIEDDGAGLTQKEIVDYLATIGSGYTRELRNKSDDGADVIGYFGLGFLTAYVVSDKVEMLTASYQSPESGRQFISNSGHAYSITACEHRRVGSKVILNLNAAFQELSDGDLMATLIKKFCCLLPVDIYLNGGQAPVNAISIPWLSADLSPIRRKKLSLEFAQLFESDFEPLATIPLKNENGLDIKGLLWIQDGSTYGNSDNRNAHVFVRNMFITHEAKELLPSWAGFVGCVIETKALTPTASREDIQQDTQYSHLKSAIAKQLCEGLRDIAKEEKHAWQRILSRHNEALLGAAICEPTLFEILRNELKLPTSEDELTMAEVVRRSGQSVYITPDEKNGIEEILCRARKIPVLKGYRYAVMPFSKLYLNQQGQEPVILGTKAGNEKLFQDDFIAEDQKNVLTKLLKRENENLVTTRFQPSFIPMLIIADEEALLKDRIEDDEANKRMSNAVLGLARMYTKTIEAKSHTIIYVNLDSPIIQKLLALPDHQQAQLGQLIRSYSLILSNHSLYPISEELERYHTTLLEVFSNTPS